MISICKAHKEHIETITGFQISLASETENCILIKDEVIKGVKFIMENEQLGSYYIAKSYNLVIGCLLIQYEWSDWRNKKVIWLHSVYIIPEFRKKGIFKEMYNYVKKLVTDNSEYAGMRLFVDKLNTNAQKVYNKLGMTNGHYELFEWLKNG